MAATPQHVLDEIDAADPAILQVFLDEVQRLREGADVNQIAQLVRSGQVAQVIEALGLDAAAISALAEIIQGVYNAGGGFEARGFPTLRRPGGGTFRMRFDIRDPRAEAWLRDRSGSLITGIAEGQREAIRMIVAEGTRLGRNPRDTALDLVGRISTETGRRIGGVIGLNSNQAQYVVNARAELESGDVAQMRNYLTRQRRDRRMDGIVERAIREEQPVAAAQVDRITDRYADRLLLLRGENIARTEALAAFSAGRDEAYAQAIDLGVRPENVTGTWRTAGDRRVRESHREMAGQKKPWGEPFQSPTGAQLMFPGDTSLGADAEDVVNCRCVVMRRIDHIAEALRN